MTEKLTLVVLAAWMGSRYGGLKQLDEFWPHGETILEYSIYDALHAWFDHIVFIIREHFADAFQERIGKKIAQKAKISYVFQEKDSFFPSEYIGLLKNREKPRGTAHATLVAKVVVTTPFAVINADDFYGRDAFGQIASFLLSSEKETMGMVGYMLENTLSPYGSINRGVCSVENAMLVSVVERLKIQEKNDGNLYDEQWVIISRDSIVSMNFRWFHPSFFDALEAWFETFLQHYSGSGEYFIPLVVDTLIAEKKAYCRVMMSHDQWCGVSYQEDKPFVQETIAGLHRQWVYPEQLF